MTIHLSFIQTVFESKSIQVRTGITTLIIHQFLRDTSLTEDLLKLVEHKHPFVRTYAFASLSQREVDLFPILILNLSDSTTFYTSEDDYGYAASPPDMMLQYLSDKLAVEQKDSVANLVITQYNNLETIKEILLFYKPKPKPLIDKIESHFEGRDDLEYYDNYLFRSSWNY